jgi:hypothetical protein
MNDKQYLNFNLNTLTISTLNNLNNMKTTQVAEDQQINIWKGHISNMSTEEIERRSLLVSMSPSTDNNILFQQLLTNEYNNRKNKITYDNALAKFNEKLENNTEVKKASKHYKKSVKDVVKALQTRIKVNRYSDKSIKQISINFTEDGILSSKVTIKLSQNY